MLANQSFSEAVEQCNGRSAQAVKQAGTHTTSRYVPPAHPDSAAVKNSKQLIFLLLWISLQLFCWVFLAFS